MFIFKNIFNKAISPDEDFPVDSFISYDELVSFLAKFNLNLVMKNNIYFQEFTNETKYKVLFYDNKNLPGMIFTKEMDKIEYKFYIANLDKSIYQKLKLSFKKGNLFFRHVEPKMIQDDTVAVYDFGFSKNIGISSNEFTQMLRQQFNFLSQDTKLKVINRFSQFKGDSNYSKNSKHVEFLENFFSGKFSFEGKTTLYRCSKNSYCMQIENLKLKKEGKLNYTEYFRKYSNQFYMDDVSYTNKLIIDLMFELYQSDNYKYGYFYSRIQDAVAKLNEKNDEGTAIEEIIKLWSKKNELVNKNRILEENKVNVGMDGGNIVEFDYAINENNEKIRQINEKLKALELYNNVDMKKWHY